MNGKIGPLSIQRYFVFKFNHGFLSTIYTSNSHIQHFNHESFQLYTPEPPVGTKLIFGSFPLFSLFKLGKLAGGGIRRMLATLPKLCNPC